MLKKATKSIVFIINMFLCQNLIAQSVSHIIDYTASGLSTSEVCNSFNNLSSPAVIGGYSHYPLCGGVTFNGTNLVLKTQYSFSPSSNLGTAYAIAYPFKSGYTYSLKIDAKGIDGSGSNTNYPYVETSLFNSLPNPNQTNPTACGAVNENSFSVLGQNIIYGFYVSQNAATYNSPGSFTSTSNSTKYIMILAKNGSSSVNSVLISKVTIVEISPVATPSFTLSPTSVPIQCGSSVSQTFTVNNVNNSPGVTSYVWTLGASNGWLYNGTAAPATITTTTNSLNLVSTSCATVSNISATAYIGSTPYTTNTSSVTTTLPYMSISGENSFCSGPEIYTVNNLPCGATVSWSASPSGIVSIATSGNQASLTKLTNGNVAITATINNACGSNNTITKYVSVGIVPSVINGADYICEGNEQYYLTNLPAGSTVNWSIVGDATIISSTSDGSSVNVQKGSTNGEIILTADITTSCGTAYLTKSIGGGAYWDGYINGSLYSFYGGAEYQASVSSSCPNATSYDWSLNSYDGSITLIDPLSVYVDFYNAAGMYILTVTAHTPCGDVSLSTNFSVGYRLAFSPNPTKGDLQIQIKDKQLFIKEVQVMDKFGNLKKSIKFKEEAKSYKINIAELPADVYLIRIYDGKKWSVNKIIKQ